MLWQTARILVRLPLLARFGIGSESISASRFCTTSGKSLVSAEEIISAVSEVGEPQSMEHNISVENLSYGKAEISLKCDEDSLRPGGTVSGPVMFALADLTAWAVVLSATGLNSRLAVTTNMSIDFLRKPAPGSITAKGEVLKQGKALFVSHIRLYSAALGTHSKPVASATATYSLPPTKTK